MAILHEDFDFSEFLTSHKFPDFSDSIRVDAQPFSHSSEESAFSESSDVSVLDVPQNLEVKYIVEPDPDSINVLTDVDVQYQDWNLSEYAEKSVQIASILASMYAHKYLAAGYALATATTALTAICANYFESEEFNEYAGTFLKVQSGFLKHLGMLSLLRVGKSGEDNLLRSAIEVIGCGDYDKSQGLVAGEGVSVWLQGFPVYTSLNLFSSYIAESHADLANKFILEPITEGKLEMEVDEFWGYRAPLTAFKRFIKHTVGSIFDHRGLDLEAPFEHWLTSYGISEAGAFKWCSAVSHLAANLPVAVYYNGLDSYIFNRTVSHTIAKYAGECFSFNIFNSIGLNGMFPSFFEKATDLPKLMSLFVGSAGYTLSKSWWGNKAS